MYSFPIRLIFLRLLLLLRLILLSSRNWLFVYLTPPFKFHSFCFWLIGSKVVHEPSIPPPPDANADSPPVTLPTRDDHLSNHVSNKQDARHTRPLGWTRARVVRSGLTPSRTAWAPGSAWEGTSSKASFPVLTTT